MWRAAPLMAYRLTLIHIGINENNYHLNDGMNGNEYHREGGSKVPTSSLPIPPALICVHNRELKTFFWEVFHGWTPTKTDPLEGGHR